MCYGRGWQTIPLNLRLPQQFINYYFNIIY